MKYFPSKKHSCGSNTAHGFTTSGTKQRFRTALKKKKKGQKTFSLCGPDENSLEGRNEESKEQQKDIFSTREQRRSVSHFLGTDSGRQEDPTELDE